MYLKIDMRIVKLKEAKITWAISKPPVLSILEKTVCSSTPASYIFPITGLKIPSVKNLSSNANVEKMKLPNIGKLKKSKAGL